MKINISLIILGLLALVSCQEKLNINDIMSTPVTKSGDSDSAFGVDSSSANKTETIKIGKWDALKIAEPITSKYSNRWIDISNEIIPANSRIEYSTSGLKAHEEKSLFLDSPETDSWLLVVGPDVTMNNRQPLLHLFVDIKSGEVTEKWLDGMAVTEWDTSRNIYIENNEKIFEKEKPSASYSKTTHSKWAVIIGGASSSYYNYERYWKDCRDAYLALTQELNYPANNIYCLFSDGQNIANDRRIAPNTYDSSPWDFDGDGYADIDYSATKANVSWVFNVLGVLAYSGDEVLVFVTGQGERSGNTSYISLWGGDTLSPVELSSELSKLEPGVTIDIVMGQSYSGGFTSLHQGFDRTIVAATGATEISHGIEWGDFDFFLHYWTEALYSNNVNPNTTGAYSNGDGYLSSFEIFKYAENESYSFTHTSLYSETPQINSGPDAYSWGHDLEGNSFVPYITGPDYVSVNTINLYTLNGLSSSYSRSWLNSTNLYKVSSNTNTISVRGNITSSSQFVSLGANVTARFSDLGENIDITKQIISVWKPGQYLYCGHIYGGNGVYSIGGYGWDGTYGYNWESGNDAWQITGQNDNIVYVSEGYTPDPVPLMVSFFDPLGEMIFVLDQVH